MEPGWIIAGITFLALIGAANAWIIRRADKSAEDAMRRADMVAKEERDARHNLRNELMPLILAINRDLGAHGERIARLERDRGLK